MLIYLSSFFPTYIFKQISALHTSYIGIQLIIVVVASIGAIQTKLLCRQM